MTIPTHGPRAVGRDQAASPRHGGVRVAVLVRNLVDHIPWLSAAVKIRPGGLYGRKV